MGALRAVRSTGEHHLTSPLLLIHPSVDASSPTLFPLISCEGALSDGNQVAMGCLARDILPGSVTFSWNYKNNSEVSSRIVQTFPVVQTGNKYMATSQVLVPSKDVYEGRDDYLECRVLQGKSNKNLRVPFPSKPQAPAAETGPGERGGGRAWWAGRGQWVVGQEGCAR